ncbi:MAG: flagellar biosynthesis protein FlgF [Gammaproteobacteria bacterium CG22_combo_CG10-13_8_21_14_all_40_8]|nr:MAG: flagellar biosynthesis protein FlgF [Gammaproteobacteria bacterium CG22_combo_CG10-13_8_21_14_all_40_8]
MDKLAYIAMSGAKESVLAQVNVANNLANASTNGFRADLNQAQSFPVMGKGLATRVFSLATTQSANFKSGPLMSTGNPLDVAIRGDGFLAVQAKDGSEGYTRNGELSISSSGLLQNSFGQPVMGDGGPLIVPPQESVEIGRDGTVSIRPMGAPESAIQVIGRLKLVNPNLNEITKRADGLFEKKDKSLLNSDASVTLESRTLEGSNVSPVEEMTKMIELSRRFEVQIKMIKDSADNDQALDRLLQG